MDLDAILKIVSSLGAMGILALIVWRAPQIIAEIKTLIALVVDNIRGTQKESLEVFKGEIDKIVGLVPDRFKAIEDNLKGMQDALKLSVEVQGEVVAEVRALGTRMGVMERGVKQVST